ncbi:MAG: carbohydrate ABC transporter permease [Eubacteriales bacterium]|nr:carbohydrate ABC transporter permease [Eubacteriales bacterium]
MILENNVKHLSKKIYKVTFSISRAIIIIGLCFILVYPLLYMISMAFRPESQILDPSVIWIPRSLTFDNLINVVSLMEYGKNLKNTALISVFSSVLLVLSCSVVGYGFARFKFKGRDILFGLVLFTIIVPPQTTIIPLFLGFRSFDFAFLGKIPVLFGKEPVMTNLLNTLWTMYLPAIFASGIRSGLCIYIFRQFYKGLPKELEDASAVDGCGPVKTFLRVMVPLSSSAFITVFLFSFVWYWNDYYYSGMFFINGNTVSLALSSLQSKLLAVNEGSYDPYRYIVSMQAGSLLVVGPPLIVYIVFQRYFTQSIEKVGIVG